MRFMILNNPSKYSFDVGNDFVPDSYLIDPQANGKFLPEVGICQQITATGNRGTFSW